MSPAESLPPERHEPTDGLPHVVAITGCGIAVGLALVLLASAWLDHSSRGESEISPPSRAAFSFENGPTATTGIARDWLVQDRAVHDHLKTYAWIDRPAGLVRIPIERAMEVLAAEAAKKSLSAPETTP